METSHWDSVNKTFKGLKPCPKNKEPRVCFMHDELYNILYRRFQQKDVSEFVFHISNSPLNYGTIQINFRGAQRKTGIKYSSTHCLRHGKANLARQVCGSLDAVKSVTRHKTDKLAEHYSQLGEDFH